MSSVSRKLILVADDYDHAALMLAELLQQLTNFDTVYAKDGEEAMQRARERWPAAALLDVDMPRIGGIEAARMMRKEFASRRPLLLAMTGGSFVEAQHSGVFDHVLSKPIDMRWLLQLLGGA